VFLFLFFWKKLKTPERHFEIIRPFEAVFQGQHKEIGCKGKEALLQGSANIVSPQWAIWLKIFSLMPQFSFLTAHG
jgi:hypothetical protein